MEKSQGRIRCHSGLEVRVVEILETATFSKIKLKVLDDLICGDKYITFLPDLPHVAKSLAVNRLGSLKWEFVEVPAHSRSQKHWMWNFNVEDSYFIRSVENSVVIRLDERFFREAANGGTGNQSISGDTTK